MYPDTNFHLTIQFIKLNNQTTNTKSDSYYSTVLILNLLLNRDLIRHICLIQL
jgi:hypothetical protein